ncbi:hypothetical protein TUM20983_56700 [Mycobacterium antarcticum]|uniref:hypothetical protein n=1 Tax=Mycolicibacterium sp. TUM20983 TaxID=3023369 RepID=UPI00238DE654|nr:hypothetical protein [Mycolicibacterium sp. TUM20983]GLP78560.1 hypothetical protein TUM20983_56700 [Mycolicibacterium sp. TUM20983]
MANEHTRGVDDPAAEILATGGLITLLGSVVAAVIAMVYLGDGNLAMAALLGSVALVSFVGSLVCFAADSNRSDDAPLPFPSWLRTKSETAAELPALQ